MNDWSPYALERYRTGTSKSRVKRLIIGVVVLSLIWIVFFKGQTESNIGIGTGSTVDVGDRPDDRPKPVTVAVERGRATLMEQPIGSAGAQQNAPRAGISFEQPYPILAWLLQWGPVLAMPWLAWKLYRRPAKEEVNFGIYKGAMPLEMISATHRDILHSRRSVEAPLFGRARQDYVPWEDVNGEPVAPRDQGRSGSG